MKDKSNCSNVVEYGVGGIFFFIGICILSVVIVSHIVHENFRQSAIEVEAVITTINSRRTAGGNRDYDVWVAYEIDGTEYHEKLNTFESFMYEGKTIDLLADADSPTKISYDSGSGFFTFLAVFVGSIFSFIGGKLLLLPWQRNRSDSKASSIQE